MRTLLLLPLASLLALAAEPEVIRKVEKGLLKTLQVGPPAPMELAARMKELQAPGVSIAVLQDGRVAWAKGYGVLDVRGREPVTPETLFQAASITKSITSVVAMRLAQDGVVDLDKDVNTYLKRWKVPENAFTAKEKVTLRRIMNHTAGLTVGGFRGYAEGEAVPTIQQVLDGLPPANNVPVRVDKVPGGGFRYSGGGTTLMQCLLEDVTGRSLVDLAAEVVFRPAGMTHSTLCYCNPAFAHLEKQASRGHVRDGAGGLKSIRGNVHLQGGSACCDLWTTPTDLVRFVLALQKALRGEPGAILSQASARAMVTPGAGGEAGLGFFLNPEAGTFSHDGGNVGFVSRYVGSIHKGTGFAVMVNSDVASSLTREVTLAIQNAYGWEGDKPRVFKDTAAVLDEVHQALKRNPQDPGFSEPGLNNRAYGLLGMGYTEAALALFQLNVERFPQSANACDSLAEAWERAGNPGKALAAYRQALALLEKHPEPNRGYAANRKTLEATIRRLEARKQD